MTIHKTAYNTLACRGTAAAVEKLIYGIQRHNAQHGLHGSGNGVFEIRNDSTLIDIPAFKHPVNVPSIDGGQDMVVVDVRSCTKVGPDGYTQQISLPVAYRAITERGQLQAKWNGMMAPALMDVSPLPLQMFAGWIADNVQRRFGLDALERHTLYILAAVYYISLFDDSSELNEDKRVRVATRVTRSLRGVQATEVFAVLDKLSSVHPDGVGNVTHFCQAAYLVTESLRLKDLKPGILFQVLGGTWFGDNKEELVAVALEHPPTWLSILREAIMNRSYRNSNIGDMMNRRKQDERTLLLQALTRLVNVEQ